MTIFACSLCIGDRWSVKVQEESFWVASRLPGRWPVRYEYSSCAETIWRRPLSDRWRSLCPWNSWMVRLWRILTPLRSSRSVNGYLLQWPRSYRCYILKLLPWLFAPGFLLDSTNSWVEWDCYFDENISASAAELHLTLPLKNFTVFVQLPSIVLLE